MFAFLVLALKKLLAIRMDMKYYCSCKGISRLIRLQHGFSFECKFLLLMHTRIKLPTLMLLTAPTHTHTRTGWHLSIRKYERLWMMQACINPLKAIHNANEA